MQDLEFRQLIERVKLRSPIEVVVGERVSGLRQKGALYWACCPFHQEKTPSFCVDPRRGTWRCFGACGEGGDVLSFLERFDGLSFLEALRLLARQCGEELPERAVRGRARGAEAELEARFECLRWAAELYRQALRAPEGQAARAYLARRGLDPAVVESFGLGWAPEGGQTLVQASQRDKKPLEWLAEAGLVRRSEMGRVYDFFRGRVLIPIRDRLGRVVGFGGRLLDTPGTPEGPKYVNTPETPLFHKGRLVFALDLAAAAVRTTHRLILVEGYTDVMAAHQTGWRETVAVLGTATTPDHAALVRRSGARRVVLAFDGDAAGRKATQRALMGLLGLPVELCVAVLPEGRDPGDLLVEPAGRELFRACVDGAHEWFDWCLAGLTGLGASALASGVEECFALLAKLERPVERSARLAELARHLALPEADVRAQWATFERSLRPARPNEERASQASVPAVRPARPAAGPDERLEAAFASLIGALLLDNSLVPLYAHLAPQCPAGDLSVCFQTLLELYERDESGAPIGASALLSALGDHPARRRVVALETLAATAESPAVLARDQVRWLERAARASLLEAGKRALDAPQGTPDPDLLARLHDELRAERVPHALPVAPRPS
ncbi:MAG TPA: DNA primase [Planctomycetota bacterium]